MTNIEPWSQENNFVNKLKETLARKRGAISARLISSISKMAIKNVKYYKNVVNHIELFIQKVSPEYKINGIYILDSILKNSKAKLGEKK